MEEVFPKVRYEDYKRGLCLSRVGRGAVCLLPRAAGMAERDACKGNGVKQTGFDVLRPLPWETNRMTRRHGKLR
jgi:hypothetical protein